MRMQHVYQLVVESRSAAATRESAEVPASQLTVRPLIPGAQVTPAELPLDPRTPAAKATFYVTPVARGRLGEARVQLVSQGRSVQEVPLKMRSVTQRLTWVLAALTVLVPILLVNLTKFNPLTGTIPHKVATQGDPGRQPQPPEVTVRIAGSPGDVLEYRIKDSIPEIPDLPLVGHVPLVENVAWGCGTLYQVVCDMSANGDHPSFYVGVVLLGLTLASWFTHTGSRARSRGKPFVLQAVPVLAPA
jgi:hypothetical protein